MSNEMLNRAWLLRLRLRVASGCSWSPLPTAAMPRASAGPASPSSSSSSMTAGWPPSSSNMAHAAASRLRRAASCARSQRPASRQRRRRRWRCNERDAQGPGSVCSERDADARAAALAAAQRGNMSVLQIERVMNHSHTRGTDRAVLIAVASHAHDDGSKSHAGPGRAFPARSTDPARPDQGLELPGAGASPRSGNYGADHQGGRGYPATLHVDPCTTSDAPGRAARATPPPVGRVGTRSRHWLPVQPRKGS